MLHQYHVRNPRTNFVDNRAGNFYQLSSGQQSTLHRDQRTNLFLFATHDHVHMEMDYAVKLGE
jgi:hypothetical protein